MVVVVMVVLRLRLRRQRLRSRGLLLLLRLHCCLACPSGGGGWRLHRRARLLHRLHIGCRGS